MAGTEAQIDKCVKCVENTFGVCQLNKHACANCAVRYTKTDDGSVVFDQDEYIKQLRQRGTLNSLAQKPKRRRRRQYLIWSLAFDVH